MKNDDWTEVINDEMPKNICHVQDKLFVNSSKSDFVYYINKIQKIQNLELFSNLSS